LFTIILKFVVFERRYVCRGDRKIQCGIAGGCFTDVTSRSSIRYHQEHAFLATTEPRRLHKNVEAACGAVISLCGEIICATELTGCKRY